MLGACSDTVFVKHPDRDDGILIDYMNCKLINIEMWKKYGEDCYKPEIKKIIFDKLSEFKVSDMTLEEWYSLPKPRPFRAEY